MKSLVATVASSLLIAIACGEPAGAPATPPAAIETRVPSVAPATQPPPIVPVIVPASVATAAPAIVVTVVAPIATARPAVATPQARPACDPNYTGACVPPYPPDVNCAQIPVKRFRSIGADPHGLDSDHDGIACES